MNLIQINAISAEPPQAVFHRLTDIGGLCPAGPRIIHFHTEFGGNDHLITPSGERAAQKLLAVRTTINIGGIKKIDSAFQSSFHNLFCGLFVDLPAKIVAAQADDRSV